VSIRSKIVLLVLPLLVAPRVLTGLVASLSARNGITSVATSLLQLKMDDLQNYANNQWSILVENNFVDNAQFVEAARSAVSAYARSLVRSDSELIFALDAKGNPVMSTAPTVLSESERGALTQLQSGGATGWQSIQAGGVARVAETAFFVPFGWQFYVTERRDVFYRATTEIFVRTGFILVVSLAAALALLVLFSYLMTQPLRMVVGAMQQIMSTNDLSRRVEILYRDETGDLGHSFNLMTGELDKAYRQIKGYARDAAIAQHREQKIRNIFQKYVPEDVIDEFFARPESMLVGQQRVLAVLFSDIRKFTTISEALLPAQVVESLNAYFAQMVEIIVLHRGIVDKYIGDAIMAFYGAPVFRGDEGLQAVTTGLEMQEALQAFNVEQRARGRPAFEIGVGINHGEVLVGNIGSERKMDYTVVGDMVNVASRLEGLTKVYHQEVVISESVHRELKGQIPCRQIDTVVVKGKTGHIRIYAPRRALSGDERQAWELHEKALALYHRRSFSWARQAFQQVLEILPSDYVAGMFVERCQRYMKEPPPADWVGAEVMTEK
jgi:adenylate cyclase